MSAPYSVWLRGTDTYFKTTPVAGNDSVVSTGTEAAPNTISTPGLAGGWIRVRVWGTNPEIVDEGDVVTALSGAKYNLPVARWKLTLETDDYRFPTDWTAYVTLQQHLSRRYLYIATENYPVTLHPAGKALAVTREHSTEHEYVRGAKFLQITLQMRGTHEEIG